MVVWEIFLISDVISGEIFRNIYISVWQLCRALHVVLSLSKSKTTSPARPRTPRSRIPARLVAFESLPYIFISLFFETPLVLTLCCASCVLCLLAWFTCELKVLGWFESGRKKCRALCLCLRVVKSIRMPTSAVYQPTTVTYEQQPADQRWNCPISYFSRRVTNSLNRTVWVRIGLCLLGSTLSIVGKYLEIYQDWCVSDHCTTLSNVQPSKCITMPLNQYILCEFHYTNAQTSWFYNIFVWFG